MYEKELARINEEYEETRLQIEMTLKMVKTLQKEIVVSNEEIDELINYFQKDEYYVLCAKLKNLKK